MGKIYLHIEDKCGNITLERFWESSLGSDSKADIKEAMDKVTEQAYRALEID